VRNTAYGVLETRRGERQMRHISADVAMEIESIPDLADDPEKALILSDDLGRVDALIERLPLELRETLVLRELQELSYREIAHITAAPLGTVMSRLWRARRLLAKAAAEGDMR
ncbi:MAG TPA: sigma factor-like helix-turn-helix DNA-binding protein, partial [Steroidobacteraceae bacterium]